MSPTPMRALGGSALLLLFAMKSFASNVTGSKVTPIQKVLTILHDLQQQCEKDLEDETEQYDAFHQFCDETIFRFGDQHLGHVTHDKEMIQALEAEIEEQTNGDGMLKWLQDRIVELKKLTAENEKYIAEKTTSCENEKRIMEKDIDEMARAIEGINKAMTAIDGGRVSHVADTSFLQVRETVRKSLEAAQVFLSHNASTTALLERVKNAGDPYTFKSDSLIELLSDFRNRVAHRQNEKESELQEHKTNCEEDLVNRNREIDSYTSELNRRNAKAAECSATIAKCTSDLADYRDILKQDEAYLKDITDECNARTKDWGQRKPLREAEIETLGKAIAKLNEKVVDTDYVNQRALLQHKEALLKKGAQVKRVDDKSTYESYEDKELDEQVKEVDEELQARAHPAAHAEVKTPKKAADPRHTMSSDDIRHALAGLDQWKSTGDQNSVFAYLQSTSFLQMSSEQGKIREHVHEENKVAALQRQRQEQTTQMLQKDADRLGSRTLATLVMHLKLQEGPFDTLKIKIQNLIKRLVEEAREESKKRNFCIAQMSQKEKLRKEREYRWSEVLDLAEDVKTNEARINSLDLEIKNLGDEIAELAAEMAKRKAERFTDNQINSQNLQFAKYGLEGVKEAMTILKDFYSYGVRDKARYDNDGKAVLGVSFLQTADNPFSDDWNNKPSDYETRVRDDAPKFADEGYEGKQAGFQGIFGFLQAIKRDYERTIDVITAAEAKTATLYSKYEMESHHMMGKMTKSKQLKEEYESTTTIDLTDTNTAFKKATNLVDSLNKVLSELEPICETTEMDYEERTEKRNAEISALKKATCALDPNGDEPDCTSGLWVEQR